jgi:hypothetical protein
MPETLQFTIATDKPRYRVDEPIRLRARLTNGGREPVVVNGRLGLNPSGRTGEVRLEVDGPAQPSEIIVSVNMGSPRPTHLTTLAPGASIEKEYDPRTYHVLSAPGEYTLRGTYRNTWAGEEGGPTAWTGRLEAPPITVTIAADRPTIDGA